MEWKQHHGHGEVLLQPYPSGFMYCPTCSISWMGWRQSGSKMHPTVPVRHWDAVHLASTLPPKVLNKINEMPGGFAVLIKARLLCCHWCQHKRHQHKNEKFRVGVEPVDAVCQVAMHCMLPLLQLWVQLHFSGCTEACALLTRQSVANTCVNQHHTGLAVVSMTHFQICVGVQMGC